jgi:hypothetical protein
MLPSNNIQSIVGATLYGRDKAKIGRIDQVLVDATDGHPTWAVLHGGIFGRKNLFVPLDDANWEHDDVFVDLEKDDVKNAPHPDAEGGLSPTEEQELRAYYLGGRGDSEPATEVASAAQLRDSGGETDVSTPVERDTVDGDRDRVSGDDDPDGPKHAVDADTPEVDESVVLVQERLVVRTEQVPVARVDLDAIDDVDASSRESETARDGDTGPRADRPDPDDNRPGPDRIVI